MRRRDKTVLMLLFFSCCFLISHYYPASGQAEDQKAIQRLPLLVESVPVVADLLDTTTTTAETAAVPGVYAAETLAKLEYLTTDEGIKILAPFNNALVHNKDLTIVGTALNPEVTSVTLKINDKPYTLPLEGKFFHMAVELKEKVNKIIVDKANLTVYYHLQNQKIDRPANLTKPPENYQDYMFHSNLPHSECLPCHKLGPEIAGLPDCYEKCHMQVLKNSWGHGPTGEFRCLACHDPFGDKSGYSLILTGKELCLSCHVTMQPTKPYVHTAVEKGMCLGCHDPHSTPYMKVLRFEGAKLCYTCHEDKTRPTQYSRGETLYEGPPAPEYNYPHPPVMDGQCLTCHEPHESAYRGNLRDTPVVICTNYNCHRTLDKSPLNGEMAGHIHPFDKDPTTSSMVAVPAEIKLDENGFVVCYSCHTPHGSNRDSFLIEEIGLRQRGEKLCGKCHPPVDTVDGVGVDLSIGRQQKENKTEDMESEDEGY